MKRNKKQCMYHNWLGGLQSGSWMCTLLTKVGYRGRAVQCDGACQFYDEGIKNKHGVVIKPKNNHISQNKLSIYENIRTQNMADIL